MSESDSLVDSTEWSLKSVLLNVTSGKYRPQHSEESDRPRCLRTKSKLSEVESVDFIDLLHADTPEAKMSCREVCFPVNHRANRAIACKHVCANANPSGLCSSRCERSHQIEQPGSVTSGPSPRCCSECRTVFLPPSKKRRLSSESEFSEPAAALPKSPPAVPSSPK